MPRTKEEQKAYNKAYSEKNKARIAERRKPNELHRSDEEKQRTRRRIKRRMRYPRKRRRQRKLVTRRTRRAAVIRRKGEDAARDKVYRDTHKEEKAAWSKDYKQTPAGRKAKSISNWKGYPIICDDWDALYEKYIDNLTLRAMQR
jgi:hypothetical protein